MKGITKIILITLVTAVCAVVMHLFYLRSMAPKEVYPDDTFLDRETDKKALILVAHDDDAATFSGTTAMLAADGWEVSFVCFYNYSYRPEEIPIRKSEMKEVSEILGFKNMDLVNFTMAFTPDTISKPWMPVPVEKFPVYYKTDSLNSIIQDAIWRYQPSVIFMLDNVIGGYGHPEHVLVGKLTEEICRSDCDSTGFPVKKIYQVVYPPSMAERINGDNPAYMSGKSVYNCTGMPVPDVQIDISSFAGTKKEVFIAHASQKRNLKKFIPYYNLYPGQIYFTIFGKEYFRVIDIN